MARNRNEDRAARVARERLRAYEARQTVHATRRRRRMRDNVIAIVALVVVAALAAVAQIAYFSSGPGAPKPSVSASPSPTPSPSASGANVGDVPSPSVAEGRTWTGTLTLNGDVDLGISLDGSKAPQGVASFVTDVQSGYYVGKTCHRLVESDTAGLIQCGSANGTGASDPGYSFGPIENAPADQVYPAGTIALARGSSAYSNGHQFFICFTDSQLPNDSAGGYTVLGTVTSGLDALRSEIADAGLADGTTSGDGAPKVATTITAATVR